MSTVRFNFGLGPDSSVISQINWAAMAFNGNPTYVVMNDADGMKFAFEGVDMAFEFDGVRNNIVAGTVTHFSLLDASDRTLFEVTGTDADAAWLYGWITSGTEVSNDVNGGPGRLWGTDNIVFGSMEADTLLLGAGDDVIRGRAGNDTIRSTGGDDTVTGGRGRDEFVEIRDGSLTITDFHDHGPHAQQDVIRLTRWEYRNKTVTQDGADTILTVRNHNDPAQSHEITLENYDHNLLGRNDFVFGF
jgi:Ca2+-binding RTX toxin-like protein